MSRIRTIKPEVLEDERTGGLSDRAFRLFTACLVLADDYGNLRTSAAVLRGKVWWGHATTADDVAEAIGELVSSGLIEPYVVRGQDYGHLRNWEKHQRIDNASKPRVPGPNEADLPENEPCSPQSAASRGESRRTSAKRGSRDTGARSPAARTTTTTRSNEQDQEIPPTAPPRGAADGEDPILEIAAEAPDDTGTAQVSSDGPIVDPGASSCQHGAIPKTRRKPAARSLMRPDWEPGEALVSAFAAEGVDALPAVAEFRDYWLGEGKLKADWDATFRNRVRELVRQGRLGAAASVTRLRTIPARPIAERREPWQVEVELQRARQDDDTEAIARLEREYRDAMRARGIDEADIELPPAAGGGAWSR